MSNVVDHIILEIFFREKKLFVLTVIFNSIKYLAVNGTGTDWND